MAIAKPSQYFAGLSRNTFLLAASSLFADISTEMVYPVLPIFLTQTLAASGSVVGLIEGIAGSTQNVIQGFAGSLSDKLHRRKSIALLGYLLAALGKPLMGMATIWPGVLAGRFVDRLGAGTRSAPRDALIAASVNKADRGRAFGLEGVGDNAGAFLGPLLALLLFVRLHLAIRLLFFLALIPGLLALLMVLFVQERPVAVAARTRLDVGPRQFPRTYWKYLLATALFAIGNSSNAFLILQTKELGASLSTTIMVYAGFNLTAAAISYPAGSMSDRLGRKNLLAMSLAIFALTYLGFAMTRNMVLIGALFLVYGLHQGIFRAVGKALASDYVPEALHASAIGWYNAVVGACGLLASLVAGSLWDHSGHASVFLFGAVFAVIGEVALLTLVSPSAHRRPKSHG